LSVITSAERSPTSRFQTARVTLPNVVRSEWTKLWSLRSTRWTLLVSVIAMAGLGPLVAAVQMSRWNQLDFHARATYDSIDTAVGGWHLAQLAIGVLGVLVISGEYSTGMVRSSLMAVPRRLPVVWAKLIVFAAVTFTLMLVSGLISFFAVQSIVTQHHVQRPRHDPAQHRRRDRDVRRTPVRPSGDQRHPPGERQQLDLALPAAERRHDGRIASF